MKFSLPLKKLKALLHNYVKRKNVITILDAGQKLDRRVEHYSELYEVEGSSNHVFMNNLPNSLVFYHPDETPDQAEVYLVLQGLRSDSAFGCDEIPAELVQAMLGPLTTHLHQIMNRRCLSTSVPQQFKDAKITILYKNKGDRGDCDNYRGILLLNVTGKVLAKIILKQF